MQALQDVKQRLAKSPSKALLIAFIGEAVHCESHLCPVFRQESSGQRVTFDIERELLETSKSNHVVAFMNTNRVLADPSDAQKPPVTPVTWDQHICVIYAGTYGQAVRPPSSTELFTSYLNKQLALGKGLQLPQFAHFFQAQGMDVQAASLKHNFTLKASTLSTLGQAMSPKFAARPVGSSFKQMAEEHDEDSGSGSAQARANSLSDNDDFAEGAKQPPLLNIGSLPIDSDEEEKKE